MIEINKCGAFTLNIKHKKTLPKQGFKKGYRRWDSNPHTCVHEFESCASTIPPLRRVC